jgi:hypothetical protein
MRCDDVVHDVLALGPRITASEIRNRSTLTLNISSDTFPKNK